jgi:hypothetical protein
MLNVRCLLVSYELKVMSYALLEFKA